MREGKAVSDMRLAFVLAKSEKLTSLEVLEVPCVQLKTKLSRLCSVLDWSRFWSRFKTNFKHFAFVHCRHKIKNNCYQESFVIQSCFVYEFFLFVVVVVVVSFRKA